MRMNVLKRAWLSIFRTPVKTVVVFLAIFVLGVALSGAISVRNAIHTTDLSLRRNMRPVVILDYCAAIFWEGCPVVPVHYPFDFLGLDAVHAVGELPYVAFFDYIISLP